MVHVVRFPQLSINHAMVLLTGEEAGDQIQFTAYDPNDPEQPLRVIFDRAKRRFFLPPTHYFAGGRVDIYQVYCAWDY